MQVFYDFSKCPGKNINFKIKYYLKNTISSILTAGIISVALIVFSSTGARGEASSDLLGTFSCSTAKKFIETDPVKLFDMWLYSGKFGTTFEYTNNDKYTKYIRKQLVMSKSYSWVLEHTDIVNGMIQGIEEATYGSPEKAAKVLAKLFIKQSIKKIGTAAGGGMLGVVYTVGEELYQFADDLTAEMVDINVRNITAAVLGEHPVTGKPVKNNGDPIHPNPSLLDLDYFITNYLGWDGEKFKQYNYNEGMGIRESNARRSGLVDYAGRKLNWNIIGRKNTLNGWSINEVRTVSHILLKEVKEQVEKKRKFKQLQGELKDNLNQLKQEQAVLTTFQALTQQVLSMTCLDSSQSCLDAYNSALGMMETLFLYAGDIKGVQPDTLEDLKDSANGLYANIEHMDTMIQTDYKTGIQGYCNAIHAGSAPFTERIALVKAINSEITAKAVQAETYMDTACAATSLSIAKDAVEMAKSMADQAIILFNKLPLLPAFEEPDSPPAPIDFSGREGELASLEEKIENHKKASEKNLKSQEAFRDQASIARGELKHMISKCNDSPIKGVSAQARASLMEGKIKDIESKLPDIEYQKLFIEGLSSKIDAIRWYMTSLKGQNLSYRDCLNNLPDIQGLVAEFTILLEKGKADVDKAKGNAAIASNCYNTLKEETQCVTNTDCETGFICQNGKCVEPETVNCQSDGDCPQGSVCSDTGKCIASDKGNNLFGTTGGEDSQTGQGDLFGTTGGETIADDTTHSGADIDCSHIPGSTAVQGNCICTDGLILSQSQGRCISCGEYYQAAKNAVTDGALNAAQSIVNEASECTSWTAQVQGLINSARQNQVCENISGNLQAACQANNAKTAHGFMAEANQNNCNIDAGLWQWGNTLIADYNQKIDEQRAAQKQQQQPQNQTSWMDMMNTIVKGMQQGSSKPSGGGSKPPSSSSKNNWPPFPTRTYNGMDPGVISSVPGAGSVNNSAGSSSNSNGSTGSNSTQKPSFNCKSHHVLQCGKKVEPLASFSLDINRDGICDICKGHAWGRVITDPNCKQGDQRHRTGPFCKTHKLDCRNNKGNKWRYHEAYVDRNNDYFCDLFGRSYFGTLEMFPTSPSDNLTCKEIK